MKDCDFCQITELAFIQGVLGFFSQFHDNNAVFSDKGKNNISPICLLIQLIWDLYKNIIYP